MSQACCMHLRQEKCKLLALKTINTQNHWSLELCPFSGILKIAIEHNISESECVSVLRLGGETCCVGSIRKG